MAVSFGWYAPAEGMPYKSKDVQRAWMARWMAARRAEWFAANGPCAKCGSAERLELDHVDPSQKVSHRIWPYSAAKRGVELAKCQALCHECHKKKSLGERHHPYHGSGAMYGRHGCRCDVCRAGNRMALERWRLSRKLASAVDRMLGGGIPLGAAAE